MKHTSAKAVVAASVAVTAASLAHASIVYTDIPDIHVLASSEMGQHTTTGTFIIDSAQGTGLGLTVFVDRGPPIVGVTSAYTTITLLGGTGCLLGITQFGLFEPYSLAAGSSIGPIGRPSSAPAATDAGVDHQHSCGAVPEHLPGPCRAKSRLFGPGLHTWEFSPRARRCAMGGVGMSASISRITSRFFDFGGVTRRTSTRRSWRGLCLRRERWWLPGWGWWGWARDDCAGDAAAL